MYEVSMKHPLSISYWQP